MSVWKKHEETKKKTKACFGVIEHSKWSPRHSAKSQGHMIHWHSQLLSHQQGKASGFYKLHALGEKAVQIMEKLHAGCTHPLFELRCLLSFLIFPLANENS